MSDDAGHPITPESPLAADPDLPSRLAQLRRAKDADPEGGLRRAREWAYANRATIDAINTIVREHGAFGDEAMERW